MSWTIVESGMYMAAACTMRLRPLLRKLPGWFKQFKTTHESGVTVERTFTIEDGKGYEMNFYAKQGHIPLKSFDRDLNRASNQGLQRPVVNR